MKPKAEQAPRRDETTGKGSPELVGESPHSTPGQAEGDRETVEESLRQHKARDSQPAKAQSSGREIKIDTRGGREK
jgi:hypothetical protein